MLCYSITFFIINYFIIIVITRCEFVSYNISPLLLTSTILWLSVLICIFNSSPSNTANKISFIYFLFVPWCFFPFLINYHLFIQSIIIPNKQYYYYTRFGQNGIITGNPCTELLGDIFWLRCFCSRDITDGTSSRARRSERAGIVFIDRTSAIQIDCNDVRRSCDCDSGPCWNNRIYRVSRVRAHNRNVGSVSHRGLSVAHAGPCIQSRV